ncbi:DUF567 domain [Cordyceps militaris]|uniref:DUF567 domain n=1 Tax=Cordyceps militaris TaxID=73501 RepID=A0A2H4STL8_CORMI|nr:DUF567 domain [Cordyceps militaris]
MSQQQPVQLPALAHPIGQFSHTVSTGTETMILQEKVLSLSGDSFDVKTIDGRPLFKVQGRHATLSGRKSVSDVATGTHLYDIVKEHFHLHATYVAETPDKRKFLEIKSSMKLFGSKATATFTAPDGRTFVMAMRGNWRDSKADIVLGEDASQGPVVARIDRQFFNKREFFGGQQTYAVTVAPGMDLALAVALCIALDEKNNEK